MSIHVQLERFEGPLGLLLHLIREQEMDIFNINIHEITRQYLEYIKAMRRLDLEVAGEFVAMAATLLHIKSRMLLPQYNEEGEEISEDPRKELVQKLVEYKRIQELSADLYKRPLLGRDVFTRGEREQIEAEGEGELVLAENPLFSLIAAYRTSLRNMKKTVHKVAQALQSIAARILEMKEKLIVGRRVIFRDLITAEDNKSNQVLVTFLSLLELAKMGFISVFQTEPFADIHIETKRDIDNAAVSRAENYDSVNAGVAAEKILQEAKQLTLEEPTAQLEGEEAPVVEAAYTDSASDEEIFAEEQRLFAEPSEVPAEAAAGDAPGPELAAQVADSITVDDAPVGDMPVSDALAQIADSITTEAELESEPVHAAAESEDNAPAGDMPVHDGFAHVADMLTAEAEAGVAYTEPVAPPAVSQHEFDEQVTAEDQERQAVDAALAFTPQIDDPAVAFTPAEEPAKPVAPDLAFLTAPEEKPVENKAKEKLNNALSAALSAFNAFNDDPEVNK